MLRGLAGLTFVALVAGCVQAPIESASLDDGALEGALHTIVTFDATGLVPVDPDFADVQVRLSPLGWAGPEPTMGVASDGTLFFTVSPALTEDPTTLAGTLARSKDHGATWELLQTGNVATTPKVDLDPWMWLDPWTDRVFNAPLYVACTWAVWSDDRGDTWEGANPVTGCVQGLPAHDHQKLTSGPPAEGVTTSGYDNVVYYSYNSFRDEGTWIQASFDGGRTYTLGQAVHPPNACSSGVAGPVAVGDDGVAYSPKPTCKGISLAVSKDSGATWTVSTVEDAGAVPALAHMTDVAVDKALNAYAVWTGEDGAAYLTRTTDQGETWSTPIKASPPDITSSTHNVVVAGEAGRVAVAYHGTRADTSGWIDKSAQSADDKAVWHLFLSVTEDALAESPVWTTIQVTPEDDPVQIGPIWLSGGAEGSRNLLDFIDMVMSKEGRVYIAYADGCDECTSADESRRTDAVVAVLEKGPSLLGGLLEPIEAMAEEHGHERGLAGVALPLR